MPWKLIFTGRGKRDLKGVPKADRDAIAQTLDRLMESPERVDIVKLSGSTREWRLRVGRWRVILNLENRTGTI